MIVELKSQIEVREQSGLGLGTIHGSASNSEYMDLTKELEISKAMVTELGADKSLLAAQLNEWEELEKEGQKRKWESQSQVLKAFKWKKEDTDPQMLRAVAAFWEAFSQRSQMGKGQWRELQRTSKQDRMFARVNFWHGRKEGLKI